MIDSFAIKRLICRVFGHSLTHVHSELAYWSRRRWRWMPGSRSHCSRCGIGEPECYAQEGLGMLHAVCEWWERKLAECRKMDEFWYTPDPMDDLPF